MKNNAISTEFTKITQGGGGNSHKILKIYRTKILYNLYNLIKNYKRCYFGKPHIKVLCYKLLGNKRKFIRWYRRHKIRQQNLQNSSKNYQSLKILYPQIKLWLDSSEFNEKYSNHPYPPLLNPDSIDYESIPAELAWDLNLPLPKGYKFLCVMASFNAHTAMVLGLRKCGVCIMSDHITDIKTHYTYNYQNLICGKIVAINITAYSGASSVYFRDLAKLILINNKETPILYLVRDPISRLKSALNNSWGKAGVQTSYNAKTLPMSALENRLHYHIDIDANILDRIANSVHDNTFVCADLYDFLRECGFYKIDFLDTSSIEPKNAFGTFYALAKKYGFDSPKSKDFLPRAHIQEFSGFLPLIFTIKGIEFNLLSRQKDDDSLHEISEMLPLKKRGIYIYTAKNNANNISAYICWQLANFVDKLVAVVEFENKCHKINENALIALFKRESTTLKFMRDILQKEAQFVSRLRPDIVESWKYYNEFEKICAEFYGENLIK